MTGLETIGAATLVLAAIPAVTALVNLGFYRPPPSIRRSSGSAPHVSVLIPARDEASTIAATVEAALRSRGVEIEVVVLDDHSRDRTAEIVRTIAAGDPRVRLESSPPLPAGWCGKQHACHRLSLAARHPLLLFVDADTRLEPDGVAAMVEAMHRSDVSLLSGVPRQITGTWMERLVVPLIHYVLLGFLPMPAMRRSSSPLYAAGCGQLMLVRAEDYRRAGGHTAIRQSRHDGLTLPRAFRRAGLRTDMVDATTVASCRMYRSAREVWNGFAKNATEGMATPATIVPWTVVLLGGSVLPWMLLVSLSATGMLPPGAGLVGAAGLLGLAVRVALAFRFAQSLGGALLHPLGVTIVVAIQWHALVARRCGFEFAWKGRAQHGV